MTYKSIGTIHTPFKQKSGMPVQSAQAKGISGRIVLNEEFTDALKDVNGFSHIILLYHLHESNGFTLLVTPFLDTKRRGLFATRAPKRPNPIGLSVVKLVKIEKNVLHIENVDMLDGTPLLDIKPYIEEFDAYSDTEKGWFQDNSDKFNKIRSDDRF